MQTKIIDCKSIANNIKTAVKADVTKFRENNIIPHLTAVQVGHCDASIVYTNRQKKLSEKLGIKFTLCELPENTTEEELLQKIHELNSDKSITGIILQMPLPEHITASKIQAKINPIKDVEGINPSNLGRVVLNDFDIAPCTSSAVMRVFESENIELKGKNVVIVGHSDIVGKPLSLMLLGQFATTTVCHIETRNLKSFTKQAEILISATGKAGLIHGEMISEGAILIDVGICNVPLLDEQGKIVLNKDGCPKTKIAGDIDFESVNQIASAITPVPGGIGVITSALLMENMVKSLKLQL